MTLWQRFLIAVLLRSISGTLQRQQEERDWVEWKKAHPPRRYTREQKERGIL